MVKPVEQDRADFALFRSGPDFAQGVLPFTSNFGWLFDAVPPLLYLVVSRYLSRLSRDPIDSKKKPVVMFETCVTMCCLLILLAYLSMKRLGLLDPVPRDPKARVASYTSAVLSLLKDRLIQSQLQTCEPERVHYVKGPASGAIWMAGGEVHFQSGANETTLPLGDKGELTFELQGRELSVTITAAESDGAHHSVQVSLPLAAA